MQPQILIYIYSKYKVYIQISKSCVSLTDCKSEINNIQGDDAKYLHVVIPIYILVKYSDNYSKTPGTLQKCYWDETDLHAGKILEFHDNNATTDSFQLKQKLTEETDKNDKKDVEMIVLLKLLSNFWWTLQMLLINCENKLLQQLKSGFKRTASLNKYQFKVTTQA